MGMVFSILLLLSGWFISMAAVADQAELLSVHEVKAGFVYNFLLFTAWPPDQPAANPGELPVCVYARGAVADSLLALNGEPVDRLRIRIVLWPEFPGDCRVVYIGASERPRLPLILPLLAKVPALVIAEEEPEPNNGTIIGLFEENHKIAFVVNLHAMHEHRLLLSSKLLRLARKTIPAAEQ